MTEFKGFHKGVNLGGWLSQCDYSAERLAYFIKEEDIERIASWGADHVRIPIDYNVVENADGSFNEAGFAHINRALDMCAKHGLNTVLDLHKTAGFSFDKGEKELGFFKDEALQERFYRLWEEFAKRYGKFRDTTAFELLNEITDKEFIGEWNRISRECIRRIRAIAPDTMILVGSYWNNSADAVPDLDAPYDDKVAYNFHCYEPMKFTHQGATWAEQIDPEKRCGFAELDCGTDYFVKLFAPAAEAAKRNNTVLYCGEYGVIDRASPEDAVKWYRVINSAFEQLGISRCTWSYKEMDFGLSDKRMSGVIDELIRYL